MPRRPTGKPSYRPLIPIDWKLVDQMVLSGCSGLEIAGSLDIHHDTFYDRFRIEKGVSFSEYSPSRKMGGMGMLRAKQFQCAMRGNTQMLKTLGEELLGQGKRDQSMPDEGRDTIVLRQKLQRIETILQARGISLSDLENEQSLLHQGFAGEQDKVSTELGADSTDQRSSSMQDNTEGTTARDNDVLLPSPP